MNKHKEFSSYDGLKPLVGEIIKSVLLSKDNEHRAFVAASGEIFVFYMEGD